jgi:predicted transcriptional regulator
MTEPEHHKAPLVELTADIASAYVSANNLAAHELPGLIRTIYGALASDGEEPPAPQRPAVPIKKSVTDDYLICLEDGRRFKSLKRHLRSSFGLSPEDYRAKWGLPKTYPMVAPAYAAARSSLAKGMGFGMARRGTAKGKTKAKKAR